MGPSIAGTARDGTLVLGAILTDQEAFPPVADILRAADFSLEKHRRMFRACDALWDRGEHINYAAVANELLKRGELESVDGMSYLVSLAEGIPAITDLASPCEAIRAAARKCSAIRSLTVLLDRCFDPGEEIEELLNSAERVTEVLSADTNRKPDARTLETISQKKAASTPF